MAFLSIQFDPLLGKTLFIVATIFLLAAILILVTEYARSSKEHNLRKRYVSWLVLASIFLIPLSIGGILFTLVICALMLLCELELFQVVKVARTPVYKWVGCVSSLAIVTTGFIETVPASAVFGATGLSPVMLSPRGQGHEPQAFYAVQVMAVMLVLCLGVMMGKCRGTFRNQCATIFGIIYLGSFFGYFVLLRNSENGFGSTLFVIMCVVFNDVLAYAFGRLFGKTLLCPNVSPHKTVEGAAGGLLGSIIAALLFQYAVPSISMQAVMAAAVIIAVAAPVGDLIASVIKRDMSVKDFGSALPGIGGMLDRCDSLLISMPVFYYYLRIIGSI